MTPFDDSGAPSTTTAEKLARDDAKLIANGYHPVALEGKAPLNNTTWLTRPNTIEALKAERAAHPLATNTGLIARGVRHIDIDLTEPEHAKAMKELALEVLGHTDMERVGRKGMALLYRDDTLTNKIIIRGKHKVLKDAKGLPLVGAVEILGPNNQLAAYGEHPDTHKPFDWVNGAFGWEPLSMPLSGLPEATPAKLCEFFERAAELLEKLDFEGVTVSAPGTARDMKPPTGDPLPRDRAIEMARCIDPGCGYEDWRNIIWAIMAIPLLDGTPAAQDLWRYTLAHEWSAGVYWKGGCPKNYDGPRAVDAIIYSDKDKPGKINVGTFIDAAVKGDWTHEPPRPDTPLEERFKGIAPGTAPAPAEKPQRRGIKISGGLIDHLIDEAERALIEQRAPIYQRGNSIVHVGSVISERRDGVDVREETIITISKPEPLIEAMTAAATFVKYDARSKKDVATDCPDRFARAYIARGKWKLPPLFALASTPQMRPDGSILDVAGYDEQSGIIYNPRGVKFPPIPSQPSRDEAKAALAIFDELICEFPFVSKADRAVALVAFLTACIRPVLSASPQFAINATAPGSGKGLLADTVSWVGFGREARAISTGHSLGELEKHLGTLLKRGVPSVNIDNVAVVLDNAYLASALTQSTTNVRTLGKSEDADATNRTMMFATGNSLQFSKELARRSLLCSINANMEDPSEAPHSFNPIDRARRDRPRFVVAGLTVLRAYHVAGYPVQSGATMGSYEEWSRRVRDALMWLGEPDPVATKPKELDPEQERHGAVLAAWAAIIGEQPVTLKEAVSKAAAAAVDRHDGSTGQTVAGNPALLEAFHAVAAPFSKGGSGPIDMRRLGEWVSAKKRLIGPGGMSLNPAGVTDGSTRYRLERAGARVVSDE
ncbi:MAG TPA: hypothetical protein VGU20_16685 [Stellaceae bacterium]|nr:hypothetical protein [Stellaceae bacterium]